MPVFHGRIRGIFGEPIIEANFSTAVF